MEHEISEWLKCKDDPIYFINNYVKIINFKVGSIPFKLYDYQEDLIRHFHENRFSICVAPRQVGKSLTGLGYIFHYIIFNDNATAGICSFNRESSRNLLDLLREMLSNLPEWMKPKVIISNNSTIELGNGSSVIVCPPKLVYEKGRTFGILLLDEFAFVTDDEAREFWDAIAPVIFSSSRSKLIITSTPNFSHKLKEIINEDGITETTIVPTLFYKLWSDANFQINEFNPIRIYWHQHPDRDKTWKAETIARMGEDAWNHEFECKFRTGAWNHEYECKFKTENMITKERVVKLYQLHESDELYDSWDITTKIINEILSIESRENIGESQFYYLVYTIWDMVQEYIKGTHKENELK